MDESFPDLSDEALGRSAAAWLAPQILGKTALSQIGADELSAALDELIPWDVKRRIEAELPSHFDAPSGQRHPIDYEGEEPVLSIRVQELFGLAVHPTVARGKIPLVVELLSPAHRPVQITRDLPGFWKGSWQAVKSEMKGRYPAIPGPTIRPRPRHAPGEAAGNVRAIRVGRTSPTHAPPAPSPCPLRSKGRGPPCRAPSATVGPGPTPAMGETPKSPSLRAARAGCGWALGTLPRQG